MENRAPGVLGAPGCHPNTLIDLVNTASASRSTIKTICMISEGYRNNRDVTGPMNFKKIRTFFFRKLVLPGFWGTWLPSSTLIDLANTALASRSTIKTICMISEGYRNNRDVTGPRNFKKIRSFFSETRAPGVLGHLAAIQALYLTLETLPWLIRVLYRPYA